jgi:hypothetical protein
MHFKTVAIKISYLVGIVRCAYVARGDGSMVVVGHGSGGRPSISRSCSC